MALTREEEAAFSRFEKTGWERAAQAFHDHWGPLTAQSSGALLDAAGVGSGHKVLDVATGAGYVAAAASDRGAHAIGLDFSSSQVELARQVYPEVLFQRGTADSLPFDDATFDAVVMGFGMNHLPDAELAAAEAYRVLKPGGWFAFTVWAPPRDGEGFGIVLSAIESGGAPNVELPPAPPYFQFADAEIVNRVLESCRFGDITTRIVPQYWQHTTPDQLFDAFNEGAVRATAMLRSQPPDVQATIRMAIRNEVMKLGVDGRFEIPMPAALSSGRKVN
ncbi:MAG: methyltransferase domain-containing protein [Alphaproteobacteria bacterium]|nr:methyltransferase domain-containing protein [Alphaproteobacteria bacterium]